MSYNLVVQAAPCMRAVASEALLQTPCTQELGANFKVYADWTGSPLLEYGKSTQVRLGQVGGLRGWRPTWCRITNLVTGDMAVFECDRLCHVQSHIPVASVRAGLINKSNTMPSIWLSCCLKLASHGTLRVPSALCKQHLATASLQDPRTGSVPNLWTPHQIRVDRLIDCVKAL